MVAELAFEGVGGGVEEFGGRGRGEGRVGRGHVVWSDRMKSI
jgi:hypothetical protein